MLIIFLVYLCYLPFSGYEKQYHDADSHWVYAKHYFENGRFSFLAYANYQRGYLFSLLLSPFTLLTDAMGWSPLVATRVIGAGVAAAVFGWVGPNLWQTVAQAPNPVPLFRRLLFATLGFVLWRNYFNFSLTDFPALLALGTALLLLLRRSGIFSIVLAGVALGIAINFRPAYQAAVPAVMLLALLPARSQNRSPSVIGALALVAGMALVLFPQAVSNRYHAGSWSPLVLTTPPGRPNLFLEQLGWGMEMQKYETNVGDDYSLAQMRFEDHRGKTLLQSAGGRFTGIAQYLGFCLENPGRVSGVIFRHLFNGLDLQYPTPYIREVFAPTWGLAWLNYSIIWATLSWLAIRKWRKPEVGWVPVTAVLLALLLPCLLALPTAMECRFLLPIHLLMSAIVAFGIQPLRYWKVASSTIRVAMMGSYVAVLVAGFAASASAQSHLAISPRYILNDLPVHFLVPPAAPEPW